MNTETTQIGKSQLQEIHYALLDYLNAIMDVEEGRTPEYIPGELEGVRMLIRDLEKTFNFLDKEEVEL